MYINPRYIIYIYIDTWFKTVILPCSPSHPQEQQADSCHSRFWDFGSHFPGLWLLSLLPSGQPGLSQCVWSVEPKPAHCVSAEALPMLSWRGGWLVVLHGCYPCLYTTLGWLHFNGNKAEWQYQLLFCWGSNINPQGFSENNSGRWFILLKYFPFVPAELQPLLKIFFLQFMKLILNSDPVLQCICFTSQLHSYLCV